MGISYRGHHSTNYSSPEKVASPFLSRLEERRETSSEFPLGMDMVRYLSDSTMPGAQQALRDPGVINRIYYNIIY